jgi:hypothetical protein
MIKTTHWLSVLDIITSISYHTPLIHLSLPLLEDYFGSSSNSKFIYAHIFFYLKSNSSTTKPHLDLSITCSTMVDLHLTHAIFLSSSAWRLEGGRRCQILVKVANISPYLTRIPSIQ